jgi:hypothetical protein
MGFRNASARSTAELFGAWGYQATDEPLVLLIAPLTALTATSDPEGLLLPEPGPPPLELEQARAPDARKPQERNARAREGIMGIFS